MTSKKTGLIQGIIRVLQRIEDGILIGLLLVMIFMAVLQIFLRNLFDSGLLWGDPLVRTLVLWIGLIGAMVASRTNNHISIDIISRYLPESIKRLTTLMTAVFTTIVCAVMAWFSLGFVLMEKQDGILAFAAVPVWICESIIPISFIIISLRYLFFSFSCFAKIINRSPQ